MSADKGCVQSRSAFSNLKNIPGENVFPEELSSCLFVIFSSPA